MLSKGISLKNTSLLRASPDVPKALPKVVRERRLGFPLLRRAFTMRASQLLGSWSQLQGRGRDAGGGG